MKIVKYISIFLLFVLMATLLLSCNTALPTSEEPPTTQNSTEAEDDGLVGSPALNRSLIVRCINEEEYLAFLGSAQCPTQYCVPLNFFSGYGKLDYFHLFSYEDALGQLQGAYRFVNNDTGISVRVYVRIKFPLLDWWSDPFFEVISDENMPEDFVLGKLLFEYWMDVLKADVESGKIEDPENGPGPYNHMRGNYYSITENVRVFYDGEYRSEVDLFEYFGGYGPVIHLNVDEATQIWIAPQSLDGETTCTELYERFREVSPLMDRLLTKSTSKAAAEELYNLWKDALK